MVWYVISNLSVENPNAASAKWKDLYKVKNSCAVTIKKFHILV